MKLPVFFSFCLLLFISCNDDDFVGEENIDNAIENAATNSPNTWVYIGDDEMKSRNGGETGYLASINPNSTQLIVYFEGGGACFNVPTCNSNRNAFGSTEGQQYVAAFNSNPVPLIDRNLASNPYADWSYIFIPYSTGDVHSGSNNDADIPNGGPQDQQMNGFDNFTEVVEELAEFYGSNGFTDIVVTGSSAGGYGTYLNFTQVADTFTSAQMTGIIDAGPMFFDETIFAACLADVWDNLFQFSYPNDYTTVVQGEYDQELQGIYEYLSRKYPSANFGLISDLQDEVIRYFFGFGLTNCSNTNSVIPALEFEQALYDVDTQLDNFSNWNVYLVPDNQHTFLGSNRWQTTTVSDIDLGQWLEAVRNGTAEDVTP